MKKFDLQDRLIDFSVELIQALDLLPGSVIGKHLKGQLTRSGTSPALNYAEACDAESRKDFIHKLGICEKELCESQGWLVLIVRARLLPQSRLSLILDECDQLIAIIVKSIATARAGTQKPSIPSQEQLDHN